MEVVWTSVVGRQSLWKTIKSKPEAEKWPINFTIYCEYRRTNSKKDLYIILCQYPTPLVRPVEDAYIYWHHLAVIIILSWHHDHCNQLLATTLLASTHCYPVVLPPASHCPSQYFTVFTVNVVDIPQPSYTLKTKQMAIYKFPLFFSPFYLFRDSERDDISTSGPIGC